MMDMKLLLVALGAVALFTAWAGLSGAAPKKVFFMFFVAGEGKRPTDQKELEAMQAAHIANMGAQAKLGKLVAAGPVADPTKIRRGITVLTVEDEKEIPGIFKNDPYVQHDIMRVVTSGWKVDAKLFNPAVDPSSIVEHRLVLMRRGKGMQPETEAMMKAHAVFLDGMMKTHNLAVWGPVHNLEGVREVLIFTGNDTEAIEKKLREDAYVQKALLEPEILPLWMSKGVVGGTK